jgi:hypothetical protein
MREKGNMVVLQIFAPEKRVKALCMSEDNKGISSTPCAVNCKGQFILPERVIHFTTEKLERLQSNKELAQSLAMGKMESLAVSAQSLPEEFNFRRDDDPAEPVCRQDDLETRLRGVKLILDAIQDPKANEGMKAFAASFDKDQKTLELKELEGLLLSGKYIRFEDIGFRRGVSPVQQLINDLRVVGLNPKFVRGESDVEDDSIEVTPTITIQVIRPEVYGGRDIRFSITIENEDKTYTVLPEAGQHETAGLVAKRVGPGINGGKVAEVKTQRQKG